MPYFPFGIKDTQYLIHYSWLIGADLIPLCPFKILMPTPHSLTSALSVLFADSVGIMSTEF